MSACSENRNERFKILVLIKSLGLGGAERLLVDALPYLDQERFAYTFAYFLPWKDFLVPQFEAAGFPIHCLSAEANSRLGWLPGGFRRLWRLQKRHRFDLIHAHLPLAGVLARLVGRRFNRPVVYTEHNLQERYHPLTRWLNQQSYGWNRQVLAVSQEVAASIERLGMDRSVPVDILLNGVPVEQIQAEAAHLDGLRQALSIPADHLIVGTVAVFRRQKRLSDWLQVAAQVARQRDDVTFLLVGHGPEAEQVAAQVKDLGLTGRVRLPGFRSDGRRLLGLMDVYLMTSEFEGLPVALLEAMALGKPVVSTAVGGVPELVTEEAEGFLTSVGEIERLAAYTLRLLNEPGMRQQMGQQAATKVATRFHLKERVQFTERLYLELLSGHDI